MERLGIAQEFIWIVRLFFKRQMWEYLSMAQQLHHSRFNMGWGKHAHFAPYLFLLLGEVLNAMGKQYWKASGIELPKENRSNRSYPNMQIKNRHCKGKIELDQDVCSILRIFLNISRLELNWEKSITYWCAKNTPKPKWTTSFRWRQVHAKDSPKLLGTPFGIWYWHQSHGQFFDKQN